MRDQSLSLRILVLAVLLPTIAAVCVATLVLTGVLHTRIVQMALAGGCILVVAILAAAISALGPKYRPTPLLTPLFAGLFAALLVTTGVYAAHAHLTPKRTAVAAVQPAKPAVKPVKTAPVIEQAAVEPDLPQAPQPVFEPAFDAATIAAPDKAQGRLPGRAQGRLPGRAQPAEPALVQPPPAGEADRAAVGGPLVSVANAVIAPAEASDKPADAAPAQKPPAVMARIPAPVTAPDVMPAADAPLNLQARFDPTGPAEPEAEGPPIPLDVADAAAAPASIPPLPRIRPCGGAGPACP
jgi:hypothetical protein